MTDFEKAVDALMYELQQEIGSGLLTFKALQLMPAVESGLQRIKKFEKEQKALLTHMVRNESPDRPPPENGP